LTSDLLESIKSFFITINEGGWGKRKAKRAKASFAHAFCLKIDLIVLKRKIVFAVGGKIFL